MKALRRIWRFPSRRCWKIILRAMWLSIYCIPISRTSLEIGVAFYRLFAHCAGDFDGVFGGVPVRIPDEFRTLVLGGDYRAFAVAFYAYRLAIQIRPNRMRRLVYNRAMRKCHRIRVAKPSGGTRRDRIRRNNPLARIPQKTYLAVLQSYPHTKRRVSKFLP